jgi:hypothetical protein
MSAEHLLSSGIGGAGFSLSESFAAVLRGLTSFGAESVSRNLKGILTDKKFVAFFAVGCGIVDLIACVSVHIVHRYVVVAYVFIR